MPLIKQQRRISPLDLNKNVTIGVAFPLDETNMFQGTETVKEQTKSNLINLLLTYPGERVNQPEFGLGLKNLLFECGLESNVHNKATSNYSKGMRQKVGIAIALAKNASIYLLDEPASGLDPLASNELSEMLKNLASKGATILMASHDIFRVRETCNKIGILKRGKLVNEILSKDVSSNQLESIYINFMKN